MTDCRNCCYHYLGEFDVLGSMVLFGVLAGHLQLVVVVSCTEFQPIKHGNDLPHPHRVFVVCVVVNGVDGVHTVGVCEEALCSVVVVTKLFNT